MLRKVLVPLLAAAALLVGMPAQAATSSVATLDGAAGGGGRITADIAGDTHAQVFGGQLHLFYYDATGGNLRHATRSGSTWIFETLDGAGGAWGRISGDVGSSVTAMATTSAMHVFYYDATGGNLRHAQLSDGTWSFATVDGHNRLGGRVNANVGMGSSATGAGGQVSVYYADATGKDIRRAVLAAGSWRFSVLDGVTGSGRIASEMGTETRVAVVGGVPHVFYTAFDRAEDELMTWGTVRQAIFTGGEWTYRTVTTIPWYSPPLHVRTIGSTVYLMSQWAGPNRTVPVLYRFAGGTWTELPEVGCANEGFESCVPAGLVNRGGRLGVVYDDWGYADYAGSLNYREWNGSSWSAETSIDATGGEVSSIVYGRQTWVAYPSTGDLRVGTLG